MIDINNGDLVLVNEYLATVLCVGKLDVLVVPHGRSLPTWVLKTNIEQINVQDIDYVLNNLKRRK